MIQKKNINRDFLKFWMLFFVFFSIIHAHALLDVEKDLIDDLVLETRRIEIPGFPYAFNPSIIRWNNSFLMSFRTGKYTVPAAEQVTFSEERPLPEQEYIEQAPSFLLSFRARDPVTASTNGIGLVFLDDEFNMISTPQLVDIHWGDPLLPSRQQDPRLIEVDGVLHLVYSNMVKIQPDLEMRRVFISRIYWDGFRFSADAPEVITEFDGDQGRWQKNWVPFSYENKLLLSYRIEPHKVVEPIFGTGSCRNYSLSSNKLQWKWGDIRGGTAALLDGEEYLSFFHSSELMATVNSQGKKITHYFMGAYTFESKPPFRITAMSGQPIVGKDFYYGKEYKTWKPLLVIFPCGFVIDGDQVIVAYGRQDHEVWLARINKNELKKSLVPVDQEVDA